MKQTEVDGPDPREWARAWTAQIGRTLKVMRKEVRDMSAQQLSDECTELGYPIPRNTITNLENGRKEAVSVQEVAVLARVLDVSPVSLLFPIGLEESVAVLPGEDRSPIEGAQWFSGMWALMEAGELEAFGSYFQWQKAHAARVGEGEVLSRADALTMHRVHDSKVGRLVDVNERIVEILARLGEIEHEDQGDAAGRTERSLQVRLRSAQQSEALYEQSLRRDRAEMRAAGIELPTLPSDLERIDSQARPIFEDPDEPFGPTDGLHQGPVDQDR